MVKVNIYLLDLSSGQFLFLFFLGFLLGNSNCVVMKIKEFSIASLGLLLFCV